MGVPEFRDELTQTIDAIDGIACPKFMGETVHPPCAVIDYELGEAIAFQHGAYSYTWRVGLFYGRADERSAQEFFDHHKDVTDTTSLWRVLADASWTYADYVRPLTAGQIQAVTLGNAEYLFVDFTLEVVL